MYARIRNWREDNDISQKEMAMRLNVHQTTYSDYELGNLNMPVTVLCKIADMIHTSVDYLLNRTDTTQPYPKSK